MTSLNATFPTLERPVLEPANDKASRFRQELEAYGPGILIKNWEDRSENQQILITERLQAFQNWRRQQGDEVAESGADPWDVGPPDADTLELYIAITHQRSRQYRAEMITALRMYFRYWRRPDLCRLVKPRGRRL